MASPGAMDPEASINSSEFNFSQIKSFTSLLKNISLGQDVNSQDLTNADSSLGLLPGTSDSSLQMFSSPPSRDLGRSHDPRSISALCEPTFGDASLGQYLQPAQLAYEETDEEEVRPSSAALADLDRLYAQFSTSETEDNSSSGQEELGEDNTKNFLGWEKLLAKAEADAPDSFCQENPSSSNFYQDPSFCSGKISARSTSYGGSTVGSTRDENFSDFSKPPSFQASYVSNFSEALESEQGSLQLSSFPTSSLAPPTSSSAFPTSSSAFPTASSALPPFHQLKAQLRLPPASSGQLSPESQSFEWPSPEFAPHLGSASKHFAKAPQNPFGDQAPIAESIPRNPFDAPQPQLQQATECFPNWGDELPQGAEEDFGDFGGQTNVIDFLAQEEEACLQENPFLEEEACETPGNSSVFSGVSDKSIVLRNSGLWAGDTSNVDLAQLRKEEEVRLSRCEYFRHNSSRLGTSFDDDLVPGQRPEFGFFHHIRSPERKPLSLLPDQKKAKEVDDDEEEVASTFSLGRKGSLSPTSSSSSGPSSTDTTCLPSGESTKTVVSMLGDSDTVKAEDLAGRLESLASQLLLSSPRRPTTPTEASQTPLLATQHELNLSTISRVLSDASVSSDPQHFVNAILGCLGRARKTNSGEEDVSRSELRLAEMTPPASATEWTDEEMSKKQKHLVKPIKPFGQANTSSTPVVLPTRSQHPHQNSLSMHAPTLPPLAEEVDLQSRLHDPSSSQFLTHNHPSITEPRQQHTTSRPRHPESVPSSRTPTPPPLTKSSSLPASLHTSTSSTPGGGKRRKGSGARHSSPIKSAAPTLPLPSPNTPDLSALANLSNFVNNPNMLQVASTSHLATSTPFHADLNLSSVILDHVAMNQSTTITVPVAPQLSNLDKGELCLPPPSKTCEVTLPKELKVDQVICTNHRLNLDLPLSYQLHSSETTVEVVVRVTHVQLGAAQVPEDHWGEVVSIDKEWRTMLKMQESLPVSLIPLQPGLLTVSLALISSPLSPPMGISHSLVTCQAEDPNIQVLTENGKSIDFGSLAEDCLAEQQLVLVNCGRAEVSLHLKLKPGVFLLEGNKLEASFKLPGVQCGGEGNGVAKTTTVSASSLGVDGADQQVHMAQMEVLIGEGCSVGSLSARVKVGRARLKVKDAAPVVFQCRAGETAKALLSLSNSGNIQLVLKLHMEASPHGVFDFPNSLVLEPETSSELEIRFTASKDVSGLKSTPNKLELASQPGGPRHLVTLQTEIVTNTPAYLSASKPTLSVGLLKKGQAEQKTEPESKKFPVECDRAVVNFICVKPGRISEQRLALRNSSQELVTLTAIVRESYLFSLVGSRGAVASLSLQLQPGQTQELVVRHSPREVGESKAKLVLKPQGQRRDGKAFKASIGLVGLAGRFNLDMEGVERCENSSDVYTLRSDTFPVIKTIRFVNKGDFAAFVKVSAENVSLSESEVGLSWKEVVLAKGEQKELLVSLPVSPGSLVVWRGPEVARQILRKAARISGDAGIPAEEWSGKVAGEEKLGEAEAWLGGRVATCHDLRHFPILLTKTLIRVAPPQVSLGSWAGLEVEETLSDTRLEQSIVRCSPPTRLEQESACLLISPRQLNLVRGGEGLLRLSNRGSATLSWELPETPPAIQVEPTAGVVTAGGEAVICVRALEGQSEFRATLHLYCDNSVDKIELVIAAAAPHLVAPPSLQLGTTLVNSMVSRPLLLSNQGAHLLQWKATNLTALPFFSLPIPSGLLNPGQSVSVAVEYAPKMQGIHSSVLAISTSLLQGGGQVREVNVQLQGEGLPLAQAVAVHSKPPHLSKKLGGLSLDSSNLVFPTTRIGETSVTKVKIKNRSSSDQSVILQPLSPSTPFRPVQTTVEVKSNCYVTVPIQFHPRVPGEVVEELKLSWEEGVITANLKAFAI